MRALFALVFLFLPAAAESGSAFQWIQRVGSGHDSYVGLGTDARGNVYVVGNTEAPDFPVKSAVQPTLAASGAHDVFVIKLDASGNLVYATCFGGRGDDLASAMAVDAAGNVYVTGLTYSSDFPVTRGAFRTTPQQPQRGSSFVFKLNADGSVGYATYFATDESKPLAIAVDAAGSAYLSGSSFGGLPATPGAYRAACACVMGSNGFFSTPSADGFVARFDGAGSQLTYASYLGVSVWVGFKVGVPLAVAPDGSAYVGAWTDVYRFNPAGSALMSQGSPKVTLQAMTLAPDGSIYVAGGALGDSFHPTPGAAQADPSVLPALPYQYVVQQQNAIVRMDGDLHSTLAATYLGGGYSSSIESLAFDPQGRVLAGGLTAPRGFPTTAPLAQGFGSPEAGFAAALSADLAAVVFSSYFGTENFLLQSVAAGPDGSLVLGGIAATPGISPSTGAVWVNRVTVGALPPLRIDSVVNAASRVDDPISGGETVIVRGEGFLSDATLRIGGRAVPTAAVTPREITAVLPPDLAGAGVVVQVESGGGVSNSVLVPVAAASPGLFSVNGAGVGQGYILNEDGSLNSPDHPVKPGERITVFATGVGPVTFDQGFAVTANPVSVYVDIFYARGVAAVMGPVDGFPGDVYQLTVYVPTYSELTAMNPDLATFRYPAQVGVTLSIAGRSSQSGLALSVAP